MTFFGSYKNKVIQAIKAEIEFAKSVDESRIALSLMEAVKIIEATKEVDSNEPKLEKICRSSKINGSETEVTLPKDDFLWLIARIERFEDHLECMETAPNYFVMMDLVKSALKEV